jgi:hypothetical protein
MNVGKVLDSWLRLRRFSPTPEISLRERSCRSDKIYEPRSSQASNDFQFSLNLPLTAETFSGGESLFLVIVRAIAPNLMPQP